MTYNQLNFSKQLIKGKITEMVFEQMLREAGCFTVLAFGYENILPELVHLQQSLHSQAMDTIRRAPDFAVINNETHDVHLIEVKYRKIITHKTVLEIAQKMYESWKPAYLFLATQKGFYFGKVSEIIERGGEIGEFSHKNIPASLQTKYHHLLIEFIRNGDQENNDED